MPSSTANELADFSDIIDAEVDALLRQAAANYRRLRGQGFDREARLYRRRAIEIVSRYVEDAIQEARRMSQSLALLLDDIEGGKKAA